MPDERVPVTTTCYITRDDTQVVIGDGETAREIDDTWLELEFSHNYYSTRHAPVLKLIKVSEPSDISESLTDINTRLKTLFEERNESRNEASYFKQLLQSAKGALDLIQSALQIKD